MRLAYVHCWAPDLFSMVPPRDYIRGTQLNQIRIEIENENGASPRQSRNKDSAGMIASYCNLL
jgi:hypothetical protein